MHLSQHLTRTLTLGLPLVGSQVAQILIGITDTAMLGRYSVEALAAGTLGHTVFFTMFSLAMGFGLAVMGIAADASGRDDERAVRRAARMGIWLSVLAGLAVMPLMIWSAPILRALGQGEELALDAQAYLRIAGFGMVPILVMVTIRSHLSALEHTRIVLWATLAAAALNVVMNWILIFGNLGAPELGIRGAAIASVGVQIAMVLFLIVYAMRGPDMARWELFRNLHQPDWPVFRRVAAIGLPIGLTQLAETGLFAASALMMGWISTEALAAHGIAIQVAAATFMMHMGLSQAATVRVGRFAGRGDALGLRRASLAALILSGIAVAGSMIAYFGAGGWIVQLFLDADDPKAPEILELGRRLLIMAALFQLVDAGQVMAQGFLRGLQDTRVPMVYAILSYWGVGIPASYVLGFPLGWGGEGIWLGLSIGLAVAAVSLLARFWRLAPPVPAQASSVL